MQFIKTFVLAATYAPFFASAYPRSASGGLQVGDWAAPGPNDVRSPCPALNTLANHGYFPRDGRNIKLQTVIDAITQQLGLDTETAAGLIDTAFSKGLGDTEAATISLIDLRKHNAIEHDVSLTRDDLYFGNNWKVNRTLVDQMVSFSSDQKVLTLQELGHFRKQRLHDCKDQDILLDFSPANRATAFIEAAALLTVFGDDDKSDAVTLPVLKTFFLEERLPIQEGWVKHSNPIGIPKVALVAAKIQYYAAFSFGSA